MINYLEDYQLKEIKEATGRSFYYNKGYMIKILRVGKTSTIVREIDRVLGLTAKQFSLPNRLIYNIIG